LTGRCGLIRNRGAKPDDAVSVRRVLQRAIDGAQPGAAGAKAQYRGAFKAKDLDDLAAYIVRAKLSGRRGEDALALR
jgi:hypothetical protein